jgi:hypothetical protein
VTALAKADELEAFGAAEVMTAEEDALVAALTVMMKLLFYRPSIKIT